MKEGGQMDFQYQEMGNRIKVRRKELKIKQAELAELLVRRNSADNAKDGYKFL